MALPAKRKTSNIQRSLQRLIGNSITTPSAVVVPVFWGRAFDDPDAARDDDGTPLVSWINCTWLTQGAGRLRASTFQVDVHRRILGEGDANSDPQGLDCDDIADSVEEAITGRIADGRPLGVFTILDYATNPAAPPDTGECAIVQTLGGLVGEANNRRVIPAAGGSQRRTMRFTIRLVHDMAGREAFYQ